MVVPSTAPPKAYVQFRAAGAVGGTSPTGYADKCAHGGPICLDDGPPLLQLNGTARDAGAALGRAGVLTGRVTDSLGRGVGGLPVKAVANVQGAQMDRVSDAVTDSNGNYVFPRLNPFTYGMNFGDPQLLATPATPASDGYTAASTVVGLTAGQTATRNITLVGGGAITGRVVDQFGAPVAGVRVLWNRTLPLGGWPETTSAADGSFRLHLLSAGTAPLCVLGAITNCPDDFDQGVPTTVRQFESTSVRIVVRRSS